MSKTPRYIGLIPAGGEGSRFGASKPKQYASLGGKAVLQWSVQALLAEPRVHHVYVVVAPGDEEAQAHLANWDRVTVLKCGGRERARTVQNALAHLLENFRISDTDWVLVHDAARPGLSAQALGRLIDECSTHVAGGLLAMPVADTLKRSAMAEDGEVIAQTTVARDGLWAAQTPQMFRAQALNLAISECLYKNVALTDDASAIETMGISPLLVRGHLENLKITVQDDLQVVARLLGVDSEVPL